MFALCCKSKIDSYKSLFLGITLIGSEYFVPNVGGYSVVFGLVTVVMLQMIDSSLFKPLNFELRPKMAIVMNAIIGYHSC